MESLKKQLETIQKPIIGCFPLYPPVELFHSMGFHPIILWGLKPYLTSVYESDKHVQDYVCSVARYLTEFILRDNGKYFEAIFSYNACDTLRNLPEILVNSLEQEKLKERFFKFHLPLTSAKDDFVKEYLKGEINTLISNLEKSYSISFSKESFIKSVKIYEKFRTYTQQLENYVSLGKLLFSDYQKFLLDINHLPIESKINKIELFIIKNKDNNKKIDGIPVIISGILPPPMELIKSMEKTGIRLVANDIAMFSRSISDIPSNISDPEEYYVDYYLNHEPCSTLLNKADNRVDSLLNLVKQNNSKGFIYISEKFCEYENFEIPYLKKRLNEIGVKVLELEIPMNDTDNIENLNTRIEAFAEILKF